VFLTPCPDTAEGIYAAPGRTPWASPARRTLGAVKYRAPNQRTARYAKKSHKLQKLQGHGSDYDPAADAAATRRALIIFGSIVGLILVLFIAGKVMSL